VLFTKHYTYNCVKLMHNKDFIIQQYIAICNKCTSVPLSDAHMQRTCSEIVHVQPQYCDHTLNHARIDSFFFLQKWNNVLSSSKGLTFILPEWVLKFWHMLYEKCFT